MCSRLDHKIASIGTPERLLQYDRATIAVRTVERLILRQENKATLLNIIEINLIDFN